MFLGLTVANVVGVPAATLLGQHLGWRATFLVVAVIGLVALAALARLIRGSRSPNTRTYATNCARCATAR